MTKRAYGRFSDDQLHYILTKRSNHAAMAREMNCSRELIRQIRFGLRYIARLPDVKRWSMISCEECKNWIDARCEIGFPESEIEGPAFAQDCSVFVVRG
jgi:hypothetical protein